ncbi:MAG: hypothetical protein UHC59_09385, partial [Fibrobacteraceae bacterium]|nr:hypothetical protein [Fibrobacteraceae bacterium]
TSVARGRLTFRLRGKILLGVSNDKSRVASVQTSCHHERSVICHHERSVNCHRERSVAILAFVITSVAK